MATKDVAAILISTLAFLLSLVATIVSLWRSELEKQRAIKKELTDTLDKLVSLSIENVKLSAELGDKDPKYFQFVSGLFNQQNTNLLQQATYLAASVPTKLLTAVEYNTIAMAMVNAGDFFQAEKYYQLAISAARLSSLRQKTPYYESLALRSYAGFLFYQRKFEDARKCYGQSISLLAGSDSQARYTNGLTYQQWAVNEQCNALSAKRAAELFESAMTEFSGIDNEIIRRSAIAGLEAARGSSIVSVPRTV